MYVLGSAKQDAALSNLEVVEERLGGWETLYRDPDTNQHWLLFYPQAEYHGGGPGVLRTDPPPDELNDWLSKCLLSGESDDAAGMAMEFDSRYEDWPQILIWLEQNVEMIAPESLDTFIKLLGILNPINREETLGKHYTEITKDHQHFKDLAERAGELLTNPSGR